MAWKRVAVPDLESAKPLEVRLKGRVGQAEGSELSHVTSERPPERPGLDATNPQAGARGLSSRRAYDRHEADRGWPGEVSRWSSRRWSAWRAGR